jgi:hypothetical protein
MDSFLTSPLLIFVAVILIGLLFLLRSLALWYWRINDIMEQQFRMNVLLERILEQLTKNKLP